jgi:hypothetical protein
LGKNGSGSFKKKKRKKTKKKGNLNALPIENWLAKDPFLLMLILLFLQLRGMLFPPDFRKIKIRRREKRTGDRTLSFVCSTTSITEGRTPVPVVNCCAFCHCLWALYLRDGKT